jgi:hypothetical protein
MGATNLTPLFKKGRGGRVEGRGGRYHGGWRGNRWHLQHHPLISAALWCTPAEACKHLCSCRLPVLLLPPHNLPSNSLPNHTLTFHPPCLPPGQSGVVCRCGEPQPGRRPSSTAVSTGAAGPPAPALLRPGCPCNDLPQQPGRQQRRRQAVRRQRQPWRPGTSSRAEGEPAVDWWACLDTFYSSVGDDERLCMHKSLSTKISAGDDEQLQVPLSGCARHAHKPTYARTLYVGACRARSHSNPCRWSSVTAPCRS